jgi:hypothetical protein
MPQRKETLMQNPPVRELAFRESDGIHVVLLWHPRDEAVTVSVADARSGDRFELAVEGERALDAFYHPEVTGVPDGVYLPETIADPDNTILEENESNNCGSRLREALERRLVADGGAARTWAVLPTPDEVTAVKRSRRRMPGTPLHWTGRKGRKQT